MYVGSKPSKGPVRADVLQNQQHQVDGPVTSEGQISQVFAGGVAPGPLSIWASGKFSS